MLVPQDGEAPLLRSDPLALLERLANSAGRDLGVLVEPATYTISERTLSQREGSDKRENVTPVSAAHGGRWSGTGVEGFCRRCVVREDRLPESSGDHVQRVAAIASPLRSLARDSHSASLRRLPATSPNIDLACAADFACISTSL